MRMKLSVVAVAGILAGPLGGITIAQACPQAAGAIFADDFKDDGGGWDLSEKNLSFGAEGMAARVDKGAILSQTLNLTFAAADASLCTDYVLPDVKDPVPSQGIIFWASDYKNYYLAQTDINRKLYIYSKINNAWTRLYDADVPGLKVEPGDVNEMVVEMHDSTVTVSVNGTLIRRFRAQPPEGIARFGLYAQSSDKVAMDGGVKFLFKSFVASKP